MPRLRCAPGCCDTERTQMAAHALVWRYPGITGRITCSQRSFETLRSKQHESHDDLPYVMLEEGFASWNDHKPIIHDCVVDVCVPGTPSKKDSFLVSAYYDSDAYTPNPSISRQFSGLPPWYGEISVVFLGRREFFKKSANLNHARKAAVAFMTEAAFRFSVDSQPPTFMTTR